MTAAAAAPPAPAPAPSPSETATPTTTLVDRRLVKAHIVAGFVFLFAGLFAGMLYALQLSRFYPFPGVELLSPGRIRMIHTSGVAYGFILNVFMASLYWVVPRLTGQPVLSRALSWFVFCAWQLIVTLTVFGLALGYAQAIEWGETPKFVDPLVIVGALCLSINIGAPILRVASARLYVTLWYFGAMLVWLPLTYVMGNYVPQYFVPGAGGAAVTGLFIHDLVGLTITPLGWGALYYFVPVLLRKPIWSHTLSLVGFWGLAFFYPLNGVHHFFWSPIPMYAQYGAVMSTMAVEIVVFTVIVNFFMTLRGSGDALRTNLAVRWFYTGMIFYFITCLQCAFQTTLTVQKLIHFSDWVPGHAHLVMFGVFGFWLYGVVDYLWPKLTGNAWWSRRLNAWNFWLASIATIVMFLDLLVAGVVQGNLWMNLAPWEESLIASMPFWHIRLVAGLAIIVGAMLFAFNMWMTARAKTPALAGRSA